MRNLEISTVLAYNTHMNRYYEFRIYPTNKQLSQIWTNIHCARAIYNLMLADKISYYDKYKEMLHNTPAQYKSDNPWLKDADSLALANAQLNLQTAFKNFFNHPSVGFPKFKARNKVKWAYTTNVVNNNIKLADNYLTLPKVGAVRIKLHRPIEGKMKSVTVTIKRSMRVYVSILIEKEVDIPSVESTKFLGLDYSSPCLYIDSEGNEPDYPQFYRKTEAKLAREQRRLSLMQRGSHNYEKQRIKVARIHEHIANQRKDFLHKQSRMLADDYDLIGIEDLNMRGMSQSLKLGKATMDNGFGLFKSMLKYKLEERGKQLVVIDKWYASTKTCSVCGNVKPMKLSEREYICPRCGQVMARDLNAAINIRNEAIRTVGYTGIARLCLTH